MVTELFLMPSLIKTAYLFASGKRSRAINETTEKIRKDAEALLMLSAIKKAKQISFVFIDQQHPPGSS
jgi:hypothetical protein